jgi:phospholipid/cholesterol/gamma-HCH transport system substrate-binding protein
MLILFAAAVIIWASFSGGGTSFIDSKVNYVAYFANAAGLVRGAPVWLAGVEVGNVYSLKIVNLDEKRKIEAKFNVLSSVREMITEDATIKIGTIGFIGDRYLEIIPGTAGLPLIEEGAEIRSVSPADVGSMFAEGEKTMLKAQDLVDNLTGLTGKLKNGEGTAGQLFTNDALYHEMTKMLAAMTVLVEGLQENQAKITASIDNISGNLDGITEKVNENEGTIGRLIADPGLYDNLHASSGRIDSILAKINQGRGTAGAMVNDDELYQEIKNLIVRIENLVTDIEQNPRKYFKFSVF